MKTKTVMICITLVMLTGVGVQAQTPYDKKNMTEIGSLSRRGNASIAEFVTWTIGEPEDEFRGPLYEAWEKYKRHKPLDKGVTIVLDEKNGYFRYDVDFDKMYEDEEGTPSESTAFMEVCMWNCADGRHKVIAENVGGTYKGKPSDGGQFDGYFFYLYDKYTRKLYMFDDVIDADELSSLASQKWHGDGEWYYANDHETGEWKRMTEEEFHQWQSDRPVLTLSLPRNGKDIKANIYTPKGTKERTFAWDGYRFHLVK